MEQTTVGKLFETIGRYLFNLEQVTAERDALRAAVEQLKKQNQMLAAELEKPREEVAGGR